MMTRVSRGRGRYVAEDIPFISQTLMIGMTVISCIQQQASQRKISVELIQQHLKLMHIRRRPTCRPGGKNHVRSAITNDRQLGEFGIASGLIQGVFQLSMTARTSANKVRADASRLKAGGISSGVFDPVA